MSAAPLSQWCVVASYGSPRPRTMPESSRYIVPARSEAEARATFEREVPGHLPRAIAVLALNCLCVKVDK